MKSKGNFASHFGGEYWAMTSSALHSFAEQVDAIPLCDIAAAKSLGRSDEKKQLQISGGVATIEINGTMMRDVPGWFSWFGINATSTDDVRSQIAAANGNEAVKSINLEINSPGGHVQGTAELASAVANSPKPVSANCTDIVASAAYWVASQCSEISANEMCEVGSVGVYTYVIDSHKAAQDAGYEVVVVSSHELKGAGVDGSEFTKAQRADLQRNIDGYFDVFKSAIEAGRGMSAKAVSEIATGQVWLGLEAQSKGLIDNVLKSESVQSATVAQHSGADSAQENRIMLDPKDSVVATAENKKLLDEIEALKADKAMSDAKIEAGLIAQKSALCEKYSDRIVPAMKDSIDKISASSDIEVFESFLKGLPVQTRSDRVSSAVETQDPVANDAADLDSQTEAAFNLPRGTIKKFENVESATLDGHFIMADGSIVPCSEVV